MCQMFNLQGKVLPLLKDSMFIDYIFRINCHRLAYIRLITRSIAWPII